MNKPYKNSGRFVLSGAASLLFLFTDAALARPGFATNVKDQCRLAGRQAPVFATYECSTCHTANAGSESGAGLTQKGSAYRNGTVLSVFCPQSPNTPPVTPITPKPGAPVLGMIDSTIRIENDETLTLTFSARDHEGDPLKMMVKGLPKGAVLGQGGQVGEDWFASMTWQPRERQKNRTYTTQFVAKEVGTRPALKAKQKVRIVVGDGFSGIPPVQPTPPVPPGPPMHPVGNWTWLTSERAGHPAAHRQNPANCTACHGANLRGTGASLAAINRSYRFEDHAVIQIRAGTPVGCWSCHDGPGGEEHDDDD
jgi:hypothetical protein